MNNRIGKRTMRLPFSLFDRLFPALAIQGHILFVALEIVHAGYIVQNAPELYNVRGRYLRAVVDNVLLNSKRRFGFHRPPGELYEARGHFFWEAYPHGAEAERIFPVQGAKFGIAVELAGAVAVVAQYGAAYMREARAELVRPARYEGRLNKRNAARRFHRAVIRYHGDGAAHALIIHGDEPARRVLHGV